MIELLDTNDSRAVRNKNMILDHYEQMINKKNAEHGTRNFHPDYIQHNPLMADGRVALAKFFGEITQGRPTSRIVVHKIIAAGDYAVSYTHLVLLDRLDADV